MCARCLNILFRLVANQDADFTNPARRSMLASLIYTILTKPKYDVKITRSINALLINKYNYSRKTTCVEACAFLVRSLKIGEKWLPPNL